MQILGVLLGVITAIGVWYWRLRMAKQAIDGAMDAAGRLKGAYNRRQFKNQTLNAALSEVETPGDAAAVLLFSLAYVKRSGPDEAARIDQMLAETVGMPANERADAVAFAKWAASEVTEPNDVVRRLLPIWSESLGRSERLALIDMAEEIADLDGYQEPVQVSALRLLRDGLSV
ncbi:MAG: hypothetical protein AAF719_05730 [Pseudomonadota bacterium]